ncbi:MAG: VWA domain-containing protein [Gammaproteobacteria bacterium]|nr:VWA domain-containing protein [Gammaproteobacteria bacterium]
MVNGKQLLNVWVVAIASVLIVSCAKEQSSAEITAANQKAQDERRAEQAAQAARVKQQAEQERVVLTGARVQKSHGNMSVPLTSQFAPPPVQEREQYAPVSEAKVLRTSEQPLSTFSVDVDTASFSNVRRYLERGQMPPSDAIRLEEMINYYSLPYADDKTTAQKPFQWTLNLTPTPWRDGTHLLRLGLQAFPSEVTSQSHNLVFLVDVSGSMAAENKLPLVKKSIELLSQSLGDEDRLAIVVYAGATGVVLPPTKANDQVAIGQALNQLRAGGPTNGADGIRLAYQLAQQSFIKGGNNRIILATDGDFNVGTVNHQQLIDLVVRQRDSGVYLTTLGFGSGNFNDHLMEQLADKGNGNYAYIDSFKEAKRVLVDRQGSSLIAVANDVKIQVEFNPNVVAEYRLLGYQNRRLNNEDFYNEKVDAAEVGAGHSITALYEVTLTSSAKPMLPELRYQTAQSPERLADEIGQLKLTYKDGAKQSHYQTTIMSLSKLLETENDASMKLVSATAAFALWLRNSAQIEGFSLAQIEQLAQQSIGVERYGADYDLLQMIRLAKVHQRVSDSRSSQQK